MAPQNLRLDDKTYDDLVREALALVPALNPAWTDHNPADPGVTLIELLAWLVEMMLYRTGQTSESTKRAFIDLLMGPEEKVVKDTRGPRGTRPLDELVREALTDARDPYRVVTPEDYESFVLREVPGVARVRCLVDFKEDLGWNAKGHTTLVVVGQPNFEGAVKRTLKDRQLITSRLHVQKPTPVHLIVKAWLNLQADSDAVDVTSDCESRLKRHLDWLRGGPNGTGWEFGRAVRVNELTALLDDVPGVDTVAKLTLWTSVSKEGGYAFVAGGVQGIGEIGLPAPTSVNIWVRKPVNDNGLWEKWLVDSPENPS